MPTCPTVCTPQLFACSSTGLARKLKRGTETRAECPSSMPDSRSWARANPAAAVAVAVAVSFRPVPTSQMVVAFAAVFAICLRLCTDDNDDDDVSVDVAVSCAVSYLLPFFYGCCFSVSVCECFIFILFKKQQQAFSTFTVIPNNVLPCR